MVSALVRIQLFLGGIVLCSVKINEYFSQINTTTTHGLGQIKVYG